MFIHYTNSQFSSNLNETLHTWHSKQRKGRCLIMALTQSRLIIRIVIFLCFLVLSSIIKSKEIVKQIYLFVSYEWIECLLLKQIHYHLMPSWQFEIDYQKLILFSSNMSTSMSKSWSHNNWLKIAKHVSLNQ